MQPNLFVSQSTRGVATSLAVLTVLSACGAHGPNAGQTSTSRTSTTTGCNVGKHHSRRRRTTGNAKSAHREVD
jgi:hypothetical protein